MLNLLYKYLVLHNHVSVPGVGSFDIETVPATLNVNNVTPPSYSLKFSSGTALTDKNFYRFVSNETGVNEVDAVRKFQDFAYQLRKDIQSFPQVELSGLGLLKKDASGGLLFEPSFSVSKYFSPVTALPVNSIAVTEKADTVITLEPIEEFTEEAVIKKDRWWVWAIVLMIIALATISYFFMQGEII